MRTDAIPMRASKARAPAANGKMLRIANVGLAAVAGAGFAFNGTTRGVAACWGGGAAGAAAGLVVAAAELAGTAVRFTVRVTVRVATGAGLAAVRVVRAVRLTVRVAVVVVACVVSDAGAVALLSAAGAGWSGAGCAVAGALVKGGVGCAASWPRAWVEESASAAAIAGRAPVRA
jgi:hypothetical protein